ncbi:MAG: hypothetical protein AAGB22_01060 [Bacteroidota bacterium]
MRALITVVSLAVLCWTSACTESGFKAEVQAVDSLQQQFKDMETVMAGFHMDSLQALSTQITGHMQLIQERYDSDTIDKTTAITISDYDRLRRSIGKLETQYRQHNYEQGVTSEQLTNLAKDLRIGKVKEDVLQEKKSSQPDADNMALKKALFQEFIDAERQAVNMLTGSADNLIKGQRKVMKRYQRVRPDVEAFLAKLEQQGNGS